MSSSASKAADLGKAHRLASLAEELYEEGRWKQAIEKFEAASDAYVSATLATTDTTVVQNLRLLANSHSQRAHELRLRTKLHDMHEASDAAAAAKPSRAAEAKPSPPSPSDQVISGAFARLSSQLISTHEELRFGAEELTRILLPATAGPHPAAISGGGSSSVLGAKQQQLIDSFYVVPPQRGATGGLGSPGLNRRGLAADVGALQHSSVLGVGSGSAGSGGGLACSGSGHALDPHQQLALLQNAQHQPGEAGGSAAGGSGSGGGGGGGGGSNGLPSLTQLAVENSRLSSENAALRQRASELNAVFGKVQRRAADQQRLARKALSALREVHATPRPDLPENAAKEIADLRRQLEAAHNARRQQAELVKKYEQRWAQLKASARRKQQQQQAAQAAAGGGGGGGSKLRPENLS